MIWKTATWIICICIRFSVLYKLCLSS